MLSCRWLTSIAYPCSQSCVLHCMRIVLRPPPDLFRVSAFLWVYRHGDLKAGNVLLTAGSITNAGQHCCCDEHDEQSAAEVWAQAGSLPLTAKVADFGLAMPLGPSDTHATMLARVSHVCGRTQCWFWLVIAVDLTC